MNGDVMIDTFMGFIIIERVFKMHIPDNYLSPETCAVMGAAMIPVWTKAVKKVKIDTVI